MSKAGWITIIVVIVIIAAGGVYWFSTQNTSVPSSPSQATTTILLGSNTQFPSYLMAANGMALYTFKSDASGVSNCAGSCAVIWPPYTVVSASGLSVGANITGTIGTITRSDGTLQVTYNGMPLYFFAQDASAQDVTGNGQNGFSVATAAATASQTTTKPQAAPQKPAPAKTPVQAAPAPVATPTPAHAPAPTPAPAPAPYTPPAYNY
jgi:predicted lipoprotein with Yx(FWY)xxD motif